MSISLANNAANLTGKTVLATANDNTVTGLITFDRDPSAPFAVSASSGKVTNLDVDLLDGEEGSAYHNASNLNAGTIPDARFPAALPAISGAALTGIVASNVVLLKANSGTDTNASATNVDTVAISGLTVKDTIEVTVFLEAITQATATPTLHNSTDSVKVAELYASGGTNGNIGATGIATGKTILINAQNALTRVLGTSMILTNGGASALNDVTDATFTQNWTGSWTLALRHDGVTSGGTLRWKWHVVKIAGQ